MSGVRHRTSSARATSTSSSPARSSATPASTPTRCVRIWASAPSRSTRRPARRVQQPADAGRAARHARRRLQRGLHVLADDGQRRRPDDLLPNAFDDSGYYGISDLDRPHVLVTSVRYAFPTLESSVAPLRWVLGNWDVSGVFQAQSGAPFDVRSPGVDIAGVGPGSGNQFYEQIGGSRGGAENRVGAAPDARACGAIWFDRNAFRQPDDGHVRHEPGKELAAPTRLLGHQHVAPQGLQVSGTRNASICVSRHSTS